jgi:hypothetical protein
LVGVDCDQDDQGATRARAIAQREQFMESLTKVGTNGEPEKLTIQ